MAQSTATSREPGSKEHARIQQKQSKIEKPKVSEQDLKRWKNDITQLSRVWSDTPGLGPVSITLEMFQNGWIQRCPGHESYTGFPVADGKTNYLEAEYYSLYNYTINYISHACPKEKAPSVEIQTSIRSDHENHKDRVSQTPDFIIMVSGCIAALLECKKAPFPTRCDKDWTLIQREEMMTLSASFLDQYCDQAIRVFRKFEERPSIPVFCTVGLAWFKISFPRTAFATLLARPEVKQPPQEPKQANKGKETTAKGKERLGANKAKATADDSNTATATAGSGQPAGGSGGLGVVDIGAQKPYSFGETATQRTLNYVKETLAMPKVEYACEQAWAGNGASARLMCALYETLFGSFKNATKILTPGSFLRAPLEFQKRELMNPDITLRALGEYFFKERYSKLIRDLEIELEDIKTGFNKVEIKGKADEEERERRMSPYIDDSDDEAAIKHGVAGPSGLEQEPASGQEPRRTDRKPKQASHRNNIIPFLNPSSRLAPEVPVKDQAQPEGGDRSAQ